MWPTCSSVISPIVFGDWIFIISGGPLSCGAVRIATDSAALDWSEEEGYPKGDNDYEETVSIDRSNAAAIETI